MAGEPNGETTQVLVVLILFVIWLLATGQDLTSAMAAAVAISWAADRATRSQLEGAKA